MSSPLFFAPVKNSYHFPPLNDTISFGTVVYDAHIESKIVYSINHVFKSLPKKERNAMNHICALERQQLLTILAMSVQKPHFAGYLLIGNLSTSLYRSSSAWL